MDMVQRGLLNECKFWAISCMQQYNINAQYNTIPPRVSNFMELGLSSSLLLFLTYSRK